MLDKTNKCQVGNKNIDDVVERIFMITLTEIAERINMRNDEDRKASWSPETIDDYIVPEFKVDESTAKGAKTTLRKKLSKVLAFVNSVKNKRAKVGCTIMPISVTSRANLMIWGAPKNITNAIAFMKELGLIETESDYYRYKAYTKYENSSKIYRYYKENEDKLKAYCAERGIEPYWEKNTVYSSEDVFNRDSSIDGSKVRFSSRLRLVKPAYLSKTDFEKELTLCLYENYPGLRFHIIKANEINERCYKNYPEFRIRFQPKFDWSSDGSYIKGIGIRATNSMTNFKKSDRERILKEYGLHLEKDINASVPRMTLSLNSGRWVDETEDIYELIYLAMGSEGEFNCEIREAIKKLHMRAYFDSSDKAMGHHVWRLMDRNGIEKQDVCDSMVKYKEAIIEAEGGTLYGSEIFYVESCVYLMTLYDLVTSGHKVWQVYDCFYSNGEEDEVMFSEMIMNSIRFNFEVFIKEYWNNRRDG